MLIFVEKMLNFVFITTKLGHIEKSIEDRMHEWSPLGKKISNSTGFSLGILKHASGFPSLAQFGIPE